jgi:glycosyltransferase involved in cell wall biosynthesis
MDNLISIIVPTYNLGEILVKYCIPSILRQTYQNFEIIVVGDGCIDNTEELLKQFDDERIRFDNSLVHVPPRSKNVTSVRPGNMALDLVKGDWVARLDDDDIFTKDHLELLLNFALANNFNFVYGMQDWRGALVGHPAFGCGDVGNSSTMYDFRVFGDFRYNINSGVPADCEIRGRMLKTGKVRQGFLQKIITYAAPRVEAWGERYLTYTDSDTVPMRWSTAPQTISRLKEIGDWYE